MVSKRSRFLLSLIVLSVSMLCVRPLWAGNDWLPVTPEDLKATAPPEAAGADAVILYHRADYDDEQSVATHYYRLKILTEEGKKRADIQIPFIKGSDDIHAVEARTIHPDGTIVEFDGKVYEKTIVKAGNIRVITKSFTLPAVTAGSIIEYRYRDSWSIYRYNAPDWIVQEDLFLRKAHFSMRAGPGAALAWVWAGLPSGVKPERKGNVVTLDVENIPAFIDEDYTPPDHELKARVEFYYLRPGFDSKKMDKFWTDWGKERDHDFESFIGHRGAIASLASSLVSPSDSFVEKLRKLYARAQQVRNTSFELEKSEQERKREKQKDNNNVEDVLKHGYGDSWDIALLFIALARAAGIESHPVLIPERSDRFFHENVPNVRQFDALAAAVRAPSGGTALLDPGTPYCPFGMLPWYKTNVPALELNDKGGTFINTSPPRADESVRTRSADLTLDSEGILRGTVTISYGGQTALTHRLERMRTDEAGWEKDLEDDVKGWLPSGAKLTLQSIEGTTDAGAALQLHYKVEMPGVLSSTGKRLFLPSLLFQVGHPFRHADRKYAVYFASPYEDADQVKIQLPPGVKLDSLPPDYELKNNFARYAIQRIAQGNTLILQRQLTMNGFYFKVAEYPALRSFYDAVSAHDDEQVVAKHVPTKGL